MLGDDSAAAVAVATAVAGGGGVGGGGCPGGLHVNTAARDDAVVRTLYGVPMFALRNAFSYASGEHALAGERSSSAWRRTVTCIAG